MFPKRQEVLESVVKGIRRAQKDYKKASESLLCGGPEYLITVNIFQSLLRIEALENSIVLEMKASEVSEVKIRGPKLQNSRVGNLCRCDIVLWSGINKRRAIIEVKRYAQDCLKDLRRVLELLRGTPSMYYAVLTGCVQKEVKNGNVLETKREIVKELGTLLKDIRKRAKHNGYLEVKLIPENVTMKINRLETEGDNEEIKDWVWRPVCFVILNKKNKR